ncbi:hypothetical protein TNCV_2457971 [Trichonephila clavipes]|nr:hypothetical protein TNCV_2457971 [Trichonephila clavipes]
MSAVNDYFEEQDSSKHKKGIELIEHRWEKYEYSFHLKFHYEYCKELLPAPGNRSNKRRDREEDLATGEEKKVGTGEERVAKKAGVVKSRDGRTMYLNLVTSRYILYVKKCPIEGVE